METKVDEAKESIRGKLRRALQDKQDTDFAWREAICQAHESGLGITDIAKGANCTRKTVYSILKAAA